MSVLVFAETADGKIKKSSFEAVSYAADFAKTSGASATAIVLGNVDADELAQLGKFGASKVLHASDSKLNQGITQAYASVIAKAVEKENATVVVLAKSSLGDAIAARLAIKINGGLASNVIALPDTTAGFKVRRSIYTGKAFVDVELVSPKKILALKKNTYPATEFNNNATVEKFEVALDANDFAVQIKSVEKTVGDVLLPEAEIVVSGGRGLKGPENWGIVEDLAKALGAATACSKPVSDMDWRPHHEHVGQTGIKVSPNLYFALGISGAIQHLAGVNSSKVIVVINKDPEAPFFKAADYGIIGDVFDVVPKLTEAIKRLN